MNVVDAEKVHDDMSNKALDYLAAEGIATLTDKKEATANTGHKSDGATVVLEPRHNFDSLAGDKADAHAEI